MSIEIIVPTLGESVTEAIVAKWFKSAGDRVTQDEVIVELETDKVNLEVTAETSGVLSEILVGVDENVDVGAVLGRIEEGEAPAAKPKAEAAPETSAANGAGEPAPAVAATAAPQSPAVRKLAADTGIDPAKLNGTGKNGRVTKGDLLAVISGGVPAAPQTTPAPAAPVPMEAPAAGGRERREPMSRMRKRIAERLKVAQNTAAMLTTFNEVDMTNVMAVRAQYKESFEKKYGIKLGFMSFFVKAGAVALREQPAVNAEIDGTDIVYKDYFNIGVAVGAPSGLVVPVLRDADAMSFAQVEGTISEFGVKAREGKLTLADMTGGTFTISNGGIFGSLLSTPILNAPQSAILGMHAIQKRPMVVGDAIEARPMMYLALSYDHRIIDGREAVTFLVRIKQCIEDPQRILLDI
jgi:2-oxoglutarate dehydrogenase E2 component (dihydrolipoamide succinyltransferase)